MLQFSILGSGSAGNSAIVRSGQTTVMVDAGLSARQLEHRLEDIGISADDLDAIILTHEHGDHTRGLDVFLRNRSIEVFANIRTKAVLADRMKSEIPWRMFDSGDVFEVGDLKIQSFYVPHDAVEPMGFVLRNGSGALGVLSDIGHVTSSVRSYLQGVDALFVEANYDEIMLQNDTKRPWSTKQRVASRHGHLSNDQTAELVAEIAGVSLKTVVLGHLSRDCNCPDTAMATINRQLEQAGRPEVEVSCAMQDEVLPFKSVDGAQPVEAMPTRDRVMEVEDLTQTRRMRPTPITAWTAAQESLFDIDDTSLSS